MILNGLLNTIRKIYFCHNIVLWMTLVVLPIGVSLFTIGMFSSQIVQHVPIGIVKQDELVPITEDAWALLGLIGMMSDDNFNLG